MPPPPPPMYSSISSSSSPSRYLVKETIVVRLNNFRSFLTSFSPFTFPIPSPFLCKLIDCEIFRSRPSLLGRSKPFDPSSAAEAMIAGGTDTTAVMLTWALSLLMNNKHVLIKAQKEIDDIVGKERRVNEHDIPNLPYLQAIVKEVLRLDMAGSLCIREFTKDCTIDGFYIPKGTRLIINLSKLHSDPTVWEDPSEFRPERFLTLHKDLDVKGKHFQLIPFGAGRRICPAMAFGLQTLHLVLAGLLQAFDFTTPFGKPVDMTATAGMGNKKATPLDLLISPRLPSLLY